ncbi:MAG: MFS transporter [Clostridia bacterium]
MEIKEIKETKEEKQKMRKRNMKLFPIYKMLSWDLLFYYTINFLFLTQIKNISASDVVLIDSFYALFIMVLQIPINVIIAFLGKKKSLVIGNITLVIYMLIIIFSRNIFDLILANFISAIGFGIKETIQAVLLKESIPPSKYKNQIFSKLNSKGATGYYTLNMISKVIAGYLFTINGYLPMICSLIILIISTIISMGFIEPNPKGNTSLKKAMGNEEIKNIKSGFKFVLKSERLKALILSAAFICSLLSILGNYEVNLLEDINLSSILIGYAGALNSLINAIASKKENKFNSILKNKSLTVLSLTLSISALVAGICGISGIRENLVGIIIILSTYMIFGFINGMYYTIIDRYLMNFANKEIDTQINSVYNLFRNATKMIFGYLASFILGVTTSANALIIVGIIFTIIYISISQYMKTRLGLKPDEYSKEERKYDELKKIEKV